MADLKTLIETVARALADQPDAVSVKESERRGGTVFELQVAATDLGRVIGRQGRTAAALRTLLASVADDERRVSLDIRDQLRMLKRMGPLDKILGMLPGMGGIKELAGQKPDEKQFGRIEAIINSMTPDERKHADILDGSRRKRVAKGSGTTVEDVNRLLKQFVEMQRMLKMVGQMTGEPVAAAPKKKKKSVFGSFK